MAALAGERQELCCLRGSLWVSGRSHGGHGCFPAPSGKPKGRGEAKGGAWSFHPVHPMGAPGWHGMGRGDGSWLAPCLLMQRNQRCLKYLRARQPRAALPALPAPRAAAQPVREGLKKAEDEEGSGSARRETRR